ncbi:MAG: hypothetical protein K0R24_2045 [Gammaproteobacteria bacterium]|jgi:uncharacterized DUF497 family protein|nr:hypothetical protein [Gammaproteobacteria bacterium]
MKRIEWDEEKNKQLQIERSISFEAITIAIEYGKLVDIIPNPSSRHARQNVMVVEIDNYLVLVPFVEEEEKIFLKTAFRSRKITRNYQRKTTDETT